MAARAIQHEKALASSDYLALVVAFPLVVIWTDAQVDDAIAVIDGLLDKAELSEGDEQYLDALSVLVEAYESEHIPFPAVSGVGALRHVMEVEDCGRVTCSMSSRRDRSLQRSSMGSAR